MAQPVVRTEGLTKTFFQGKHEIMGVDHVDLTLEEGSFTAIVGKSGSGKSTLLHLIGGLDTPTAGEIWLDGVAIARMKESRLSVLRQEKIGFVFQFFNLIPELTVEENILFPSLLSGRTHDSGYLRELMELLELTDRSRHLPSQLSGGQQQRTAVARALMTRPRLVLLDEPTGNLDEASSAMVMEMLHTVRGRYGQAMAIVTHDRDIAATAENSITLKDGKVQREGRL